MESTSNQNGPSVCSTAIEQVPAWLSRSSTAAADALPAGAYVFVHVLPPLDERARDRRLSRETRDRTCEPAEKCPSHLHAGIWLALAEACMGRSGMTSARPRMLFVSDLTYPAAGRRYCDEDIFLSSRLRESFDVALCHPRDAVALTEGFDVVVVRNSGPVVDYLDAYDEFRDVAVKSGRPVYNQLTGKADMLGKRYLTDLSVAGYPVIPTVDCREELARLPETDEYVVKPVRGADSAGLRFVGREHLADLRYDGLVVQPRVDIRYEVSFYFVDHAFQYSLYAPRSEQRWALRRYEPTSADLGFARDFIDWNDIDHGIQRVDACRTRDGGLLLVELEDLNPYLSLDCLDRPTRDTVTDSIERSVHAMLRAEARR
jgi:hypothetical protein